MSALDERYDIAILGTSLPLSILSAALSRAGYSVLHVDDAEYYGGPWASLTLQELQNACGGSGSGGIVDMSMHFADEATEAALLALNRHFAVSLAPTLLPCSGPTIDVLIRSRVASYCTFRLLQQTAIYSNEGRAKDVWPLRTVPSSKEDIFKDKSLSLVDKRRLMKLLQMAAATSSSDALDTQSSFYDYLTAPDGPGFSQRLASDVAYGVAMCASADESATRAMKRVQRHIESVGRYGNSAYLVGQYGGAGEMAQCYCRASAVQGGTFVLGHKVDALTHDAQGEPWTLSLADIEGSTKVRRVIADEDVLQRVKGTRPTRAKAEERQAIGIMLLDRGMCLKAGTEGDHDQPPPPPPPPPETALVVFPPHDDGGDSADVGAVWALQMGEGTFSCPKGTYLVYLCAALPQTADRLGTSDDARRLLHNARQGVLQLAQRSPREWSGCPNDECVPLFECYVVRESTTAEATDFSQGLSSVSSSSIANLATALDEATVQAEDLYWALHEADVDQNGEQHVSRAHIEAQRRRLRRAAASAYAVGRGLAGQLAEEEEQSESSCKDFFPVQDEHEHEL